MEVKRIPSFFQLRVDNYISDSRDRHLFNKNPNIENNLILIQR